MRRPRSTRSDTGFAIAGIGLLTATLLAGCTGLPGTAPTSASTGGASPTLAPGHEVTPTSAPELHPDGTAAQNLQYFTSVVERFQAANGWGYGSQQVVGALTGAGFNAGAIEVTDSRTPNGYQAVSIETSVRFGDECLVATLRADRATTQLLALLPSGRCLLPNS